MDRQIAFKQEEKAKENEHKRDMARRGDTFRNLSACQSFQYNLQSLPFATPPPVMPIPTMPYLQMNQAQQQLMYQQVAQPHAMPFQMQQMPQAQQIQQMHQMQQIQPQASSQMSQAQSRIAVLKQELSQDGVHEETEDEEGEDA